MRKSFLAACAAALVSLFSGCGMAPQGDCGRSGDDSGLDPSATPASPTPGPDQTPPTTSNACTEGAITAATNACINGGGQIDNFSCDPVYGIQFDCDTSCVDSSGCTAEQITAANSTCSATWVTSMVCSGGSVAVTCGSTGGDGINPTPIPGEPQCSDGSDNDDDGLIDYPADPGCSSADDDSELDTVTGDKLGQWGCVHAYDSAIQAWFATHGVPEPVVIQESYNQVWLDSSRPLYWWELGMLDLDGDYLVDSSAWTCESWADGTDDDTDDDGDGYSENQGDFDDQSAGNKPGATDSCGDAVDNDYDGLMDEACEDDVDKDGVTEMHADCNDKAATVYPGAPEYNNGVDDDCDCLADSDGDGKVCDAGDTGVDEPSSVDTDGDGFCEDGVDTDGDGDCRDSGEYSTAVFDCAEGNPDVHPGAIDYGGDGVNQDCDDSTPP